MPILKISENVRKYALEVIRVPISPLGDCPQCQGNGYRDGICPDCHYVDPQVQQAIAEWQQAQGIQQKAAFRSLSFVDMFPDIQSTKTKCPRCKQKTMVDGQCEDAKCGHEQPPEGLGFKTPKFLGIDPRMLKKVKRNFLSPASQKIEDNKKKLEKKSAKGVVDLGALQDDSMNAKTDATTRMSEMLQQSAQMDAQAKNNPKNADNSEEQQ